MKPPKMEGETMTSKRIDEFPPCGCKCGNTFFELYKQPGKYFSVRCGRCQRLNYIRRNGNDEELILTEYFPDISAEEIWGERERQNETT